MLSNPPKPWAFSTADEYCRASVAHHRSVAREARAALRRHRRARNARMCATLARTAFDFATRLLPWLQFLSR